MVTPAREHILYHKESFHPERYEVSFHRESHPLGEPSSKIYATLAAKEVGFTFPMTYHCWPTSSRVPRVWNIQTAAWRLYCMAGKTRCRRLQAMWATKRILCSRNQGQFISGSEGSSWWVCPGMSREARLMQRKIPHGCRFQTSRTAWTRTSGGRGCMRMRRIWCMHAYSMWKTQLKSLWHPSQQAILTIFVAPKQLAPGMLTHLHSAQMYPNVWLALGITSMA